MSFDLLVLGGGPGGSVAALRGAQLGLKVCLIEKEQVGGVCLNKGCIPSKTLLAGTELFQKMEKAGEWGIEFGAPPRWDYKKLFDRKEAVVARIRQSLETLMEKRKIFRVNGVGKLIGENQVEVAEQRYAAAKIILATGSSPKQMDFGVKDREKVFFSEEALSPRRIPASLLVLGGGPEGCEFALIYRGLGARVIVVEAQERLLPGFDRDVSAAVKRALLSKGIEIRTGAMVERVEKERAVLRVSLKDTTQPLSVEAVLVSVGRTPNTEGIGVESIGLACDEQKAVVTDAGLQTNLPGIYAIGDVTGRHMMAHTASYEGYVTAGALAGRKEVLDYEAVPSCVYTYPEAAEVGLNEEKANQTHVPYEIGRFSFMALGRSHAKGQTEGFVKIIGHAKTNVVLGGAIVGEGAADLINLITLAVKKKLTVEDLRSHIAPHPSGSEAIVEAAHLFFKEGLYVG